MVYMKCGTHRGVILEVSEKLIPLSDININRCSDGAPHIYTHLAAGVPLP